jgi:hypothetical protein
LSRKDGIYIIRERKHKSKAFTWVFVGILAIIAIYVPFFGMNLQYQVGSFFHFVFSKLGDLCTWVGWILFGFSILGTIYSKKIYLRIMAFGILLLWIGVFLTGQAFELLGFLIGGNQPPQGYH